jgi:hypothetical protein
MTPHAREALRRSAFESDIDDPIGALLLADLALDRQDARVRGYDSAGRRVSLAMRFHMR